MQRIERDVVLADVGFDLVKRPAYQRIDLDETEPAIPPDYRRGRALGGLIAADCGALNGARNIVLADGIWRDEALGFDRSFLFFGEDLIAEARIAWRDLSKREGIECRFWKQDEAGKWSRER